MGRRFIYFSLDSDDFSKFTRANLMTNCLSSNETLNIRRENILQ